MFLFRVLELEEQIKKEKDQADLLLEQQRVVMLLLSVFLGVLINWLLDVLHLNLWTLFNSLFRAMKLDCKNYNGR